MRPRVEARTTEFDCRSIAELLDAQAAAPKPIEHDLEADIEIATDSATASPKTAPSRLAHTLRRDGTETARGSQQIVIAAPPETPETPPSVEPSPMPNGTMATTPMPVLMASMLASESTLDPTFDPPPVRSRIWWLVAGAALLMSTLALVGALRA